MTTDWIRNLWRRLAGLPAVKRLSSPHLSSISPEDSGASSRLVRTHTYGMQGADILYDGAPASSAQKTDFHRWLFVSQELISLLVTDEQRKSLPGSVHLGNALEGTLTFPSDAPEGLRGREFKVKANVTIHFLS